ncbi:MAG: hypothetical protein Q8S14_11400 [Algoriphagus sp.]|jgi:hypothetical protein|uniref:hypothetical protein n=1 Tax=Algoriphagus sp. TaxID=1872435 RepID=UPI002721B4C0|nr:hypothetical protein [Algoriphagus sp.]MDO8966060.1 hypothetical protein [Algoriphagus sp.]MDP3199263.1 hypothetical protein [Algoriphagus sp.]MDP3472470.1 hypothetical protein [Algoriphagus sp.]
MKEIGMTKPDASVLIKKLESGEISREEFDLFLEGLEDPKQIESYEEAFRRVFDRFFEDDSTSELNKSKPKSNQNS